MWVCMQHMYNTIYDGTTILESIFLPNSMAIYDSLTPVSRRLRTRLFAFRSFDGCRRHRRFVGSVVLVRVEVLTTER